MIFLIIVTIHASDVKRVFSYETTLYGVKFSWQTTVWENHKILINFIKNDVKKINLDPDCIWGKECHGKVPNLDDHIKKLEIDTLGAFKVKNKGKRDYSAISQGYILDLLRHKVKGPYILDFSGDMLISQSEKFSPYLSVNDPIWKEFEFARIYFPSGIMIASGGKHVGGEIREKKHLKKNRIQKVVLFAPLKTNALEVDAWATAIISGGRKILEIMSIKKKWAYLYFDFKGRPTCSSEIVCDFKNKKIIVNL